MLSQSRHVAGKVLWKQDIQQSSNRCGKTTKHRHTSNRPTGMRSLDSIIYPKTAQAFLLYKLFTVADPILQISAFHKFSAICQVVPATETRKKMLYVFIFLGVLLGDSEEPFGQLKATAAGLYPSWQQPFADKQPRHKAVVSCRAAAHHFPSPTTAVE